MIVGWILCRYHLPLIDLRPDYAEITSLEDDVQGKIASLEVESGVPVGGPSSPGALPAGGSGTWSQSMDLELFHDEEDDE